MSDMTEAEERQALNDYYEQKQREKKQELLEAGLMDTGPEVVGGVSYSPGETKTCRHCDETTPTQDWTPAGPTGTQRNGVEMRLIVGEHCPACGHFQ